MDKQEKRKVPHKFESLRQKSKQRMAGKKGKDKAKAFLSNLNEDFRALRAQAEGQTREEILADVDALIAQTTAYEDEFAEELSK